MPDVSLTEYLTTITEDPQVSEQDRALATRALTQWGAGIIPSTKVLKQLSRALAQEEPCTRIAHDGACGWLRINGRKHELPVPPQGERALCPYLQAFSRCPGYKKTR